MAILDLPALESYVAIDCEMVTTRSGPTLAKVGVVNHTGEVLLESFVHVNPANVLNYRTSSSGIRPGDLIGAPTFEQIKPIIDEIIKDKIVVGHTLFNDLAVCHLSIPYELMRDTALYRPLRQLMGMQHEGESPSLKKLVLRVLGREIQAEGTHESGREGHCPVEDARATMEIFLSVRVDYEASLIKDEDVVAGIPR